MFVVMIKEKISWEGLPYDTMILKDKELRPWKNIDMSGPPRNSEFLNELFLLSSEERSKRKQLRLARPLFLL